MGKGRGIIKTVCLENNPDMVEFVKKQRNFSASIRDLILMYIEKEGMQDVDLTFSENRTENFKKEIQRLREEVAALRREKARQAAVPAPEPTAPPSLQPQPQTQPQLSAQPSGIPEGYL